MDAARDVVALDVLDGAARGAHLVLPPDGSLVLGRAEDADLLLPDDGVSRKHALVVAGAKGVVVCDLGSTNGTLLNGRPVEGSQPLVPGDVLEIGGVRVHCSAKRSDPGRAATSTMARPAPARTSGRTTEVGRPPLPRAAAAGRRLKAAVLTAGALAAAASAVLALWPDPDPQDRGVITSAAVAVDQPLSAFLPVPRIRERSDAAARPYREPVEPRVRLVALTAGEVLAPAPLEPPGAGRDDGPGAGPGPGGTAAGREPSGTDIPESPEPTGPEPTGPEPTGPEPTGSEPTGPEPTGSEPVDSGPEGVSPSELRTMLSELPMLLELSPREQEERVDLVISDEVLEEWILPVHEQVSPPPELDGAEDAPVLAAYPLSVALGEEGEELPADEAARRLAARLEQVRSRQNGDKRDLVGAETDVDVELDGLRGATLLLFWKLVPAAGQQLSEDWATPTVAYRLTPETERDVASLPVWVPLPEVDGPFQLRLYLVHEQADRVLDTHLTAPFG